MGTDRDYESVLGRVLQLHDVVAPIHPFLGRVFPIAIVDNGHFLVYEADPSLKRYIPAGQTPVPMAVPQQVRAAFPLDCLSGRCACVVTPDVFDSLDGYALIFHEFVHCRQWETSEPQLKERLGIARDAAARGDYMWELNYPFGYGRPAFVSSYRSLLEALKTGDREAVYRCREALLELLPEDQYEYMVWQEWKEGSARYVENLLRRRIELTESHGGIEEPLERVVFYEGGARLVQFLEREEPGITAQMEGLFERMLRLRQ